ncbi:MAG: glycosyltransferase [Oscillospiraceae bacterium]
MKVLILTGKFGMGHWSASLSLQQQLEKGFPAADIRVLDFFEYAMPGASEAMYKAFSLLVTHGSGIYNTFYKLTENGKPDSVPPFASLMAEKIAELVNVERPDAIVVTHPVCAQIVSRYKLDSGSALPLVTCVTDMTAHSEWLCAKTDGYLVGSPALKKALVCKGIDPRTIIVTGIPVKDEFRSIKTEKRSGKRELLIMGGGLGLMPRGEKFYEALNALENVHTVMITGGNKKLFEKLSGKYENIEVVGYTDKVYQYMAKADLMLSKPGGITVFEAITSGLPILAWEPFLQQERNNANYLLRNGMGRVANKEPERCLESIRNLIYKDDMLSWMRDNMAKVRGQLEVEGLDGLLSALTEKEKVCA